MKREFVERLFPDATKEQIDALLDQAGAELTEKNEQLAKAQSGYDEALARLTESQKGLALSEARIEELTERLKEGMSAEELLARREEEAAAREREFALKSNALDAREVLQAAGIAGAEAEALLEGVVCEDAERTMALAKGIAATVASQREAAAQAKQEELLKSNPGLDGAAAAGGVTKESFGKLSFSEQMELLKDAPGLLGSLK